MGALDRNSFRSAALPAAALAAVIACAAAAGCGDDEGLGDPPPEPSPQDPVHPLPRGKPEKRDRPPRSRIRAARCPAGAANCASAVGTVLYTESVDPDGDGDLHVVASATGGDAVTGGGLVVFDVSKDLRPRRDPKPGDVVTGAGPVYRGSYGQRQIEVAEFRVARR